MALKKCKECGHEISKKADKCPNCGAPQKSKQYGCGTLIAVVLLGGFLISLFSTNDNTTSTSSSKSDSGVSSKPTKSLEERKQDYVAKLKRELDGLGKFKVDTYLDSKDSIILGVVLFSVWATIAEEGGKFNLNEEEKKLLRDFKKKMSKLQIKAFPGLRNAYGPAVRKTLWEHDLSVRTFGKGFRIIEFVGGVFAANRNIKEFQENVSNILHQLRFKQSRFKWYKEADKYTYYDMKSHKDSELIIWVGGGSYREVSLD